MSDTYVIKIDDSNSNSDSNIKKTLVKKNLPYQYYFNTGKMPLKLDKVNIKKNILDEQNNKRGLTKKDLKTIGTNTIIEGSDYILDMVLDHKYNVPEEVSKDGRGIIASLAMANSIYRSDDKMKETFVQAGGYTGGKVLQGLSLVFIPKGPWTPFVQIGAGAIGNWGGQKLSESIYETPERALELNTSRNDLTGNYYAFTESEPIKTQYDGIEGNVGHSRFIRSYKDRLKKINARKNSYKDTGDNIGHSRFVRSYSARVKKINSDNKSITTNGYAFTDTNSVKSMYGNTEGNVGHSRFVRNYVQRVKEINSNNNSVTANGYSFTDQKEDDINSKKYSAVQNQFKKTAGSLVLYGGINDQLKSEINVLNKKNKELKTLRRPTVRHGINQNKKAASRSTPKYTRRQSKQARKVADSETRAVLAMFGIRKFANGGLVNKTTMGMVGEDGPEAIIPLSSKRRDRGLQLWSKAGDMLGAKGRRSNEVGKRQKSGNSSDVRVGSVTIAVKGKGKNPGENTNLLSLLQEQRGQISDELCSILADALEGAYKNIPVAQ